MSLQPQGQTGAPGGRDEAQPLLSARRSAAGVLTAGRGHQARAEPDAPRAGAPRPRAAPLNNELVARMLTAADVAAITACTKPGASLASSASSAPRAPAARPPVMHVIVPHTATADPCIVGCLARQGSRLTGAHLGAALFGSLGCRDRGNADGAGEVGAGGMGETEEAR